LNDVLGIENVAIFYTQLIRQMTAQTKPVKTKKKQKEKTLTRFTKLSKVATIISY